MTLQKRQRGRPRQYDREAALRAARTVFWEKGFSATSVDDLCAAMGISKPSLYAAFRNKLALYLEVLGHYEAEGRAAMEARLAHPDLATALRQAGAGAIANFIAGEVGARGCLLVGTAVVEAVTERAVRTELRDDMMASGALFEARFARAVAEGFAAPMPPALLGAIMRDAIYATALHARAGAGREELLATLDAVITLLVGPTIAANPNHNPVPQG